LKGKLNGSEFYFKGKVLRIMTVKNLILYYPYCRLAGLAVNTKSKLKMSYGVTVLDGEAKRVCLLGLPLEAGNITKVVDVRSVTVM
jgi:hypothetical protein